MSTSSSNNLVSKLDGKGQICRKNWHSIPLVVFSSIIKITFFQAVGAVPSAFDTYLVIRGIKTLHLRMRQHMENAMAIAKWLEADSRVEKASSPIHILIRNNQCYCCCRFFTPNWSPIRSTKSTKSRQPECRE